ncbi:MAG TPA: DEAD/DEAH box helicase [Candidatus Ornithospirochaeta stercorigallinarum]|nr:DEAD/DEAH box helicase [Candidatus Ornithospirochaeta stercorigallinarum]
MVDKEKPLLVQSDRTILLDLSSNDAENARLDIIPFAELVKSPEHMHTYTLSPLSLWNAISAGLSAEEIITRLRKWSRYDIDQRVLFFIEDTAGRYGDFILTEDEENTERLLLKVKRKLFFMQIASSNLAKKYLKPEGEGTFSLDRLNRGRIKVELIKMGFPVDDRIPLSRGESVEMDLSGTFSARDYQESAVNSFLGNGERGTGFSTIVLPCGSGKTIVGILAMARLKTRTLILCPNVQSVHQWIREIRTKTNIADDMIGEYSGDVKEMKPITVSTYQILTYRKPGTEEYAHFSLLRDGRWGFIIYDEVHMLPAPVFRITAELQSIYRLGLTATLIREDGREDEVFSLVGPKRYDSPWSELAQRGYIAEAYCHEIRVPLMEEDEVGYALASKREKYRIASVNRRKLDIVEGLVQKHSEDSIIIIGQYIEQLEEVGKRFSWPIVTGKTSNKVRDEIYQKFRNKEIRVLIVSKVANFAIDLPDCSVAIQISGTFGSRQEEAQRLGRILRPKERPSHFYTIITEYSEEEEFAMNRQKFLSEQGYSYTLERVDV